MAHCHGRFARERLLKLKEKMCIPPNPIFGNSAQLYMILHPFIYNISGRSWEGSLSERKETGRHFQVSSGRRLAPVIPWTTNIACFYEISK